MSKSEYEVAVEKVILEPVPLNETYWDLEYSGGGVVQYSASQELPGLVLLPKKPLYPGETYAALVLSNKRLMKPPKDFIFEVEVVNQQQLRELTPNPWEVFWFFFNYRVGVDGKKEANYFIPKFEKGIELGKAYGEVGQTFLKTSSSPSTELTVPEIYTFIKKGQSFKVFKNRKRIMSFQGHVSTENETTPQDSFLFDHAGQFGLYTEDALVKIISVKFVEL